MTLAQLVGDAHQVILNAPRKKDAADLEAMRCPQGCTRQASEAEIVENIGKTTFQWLIERGPPEGESQAVWLEHSLWHPARDGCWTTDANEAAMFPSKMTAWGHIVKQGLTARAVEHGFMSPRAVAMADLEYVLVWLRQSEAPENIIGLQERGMDAFRGATL